MPRKKQIAQPSHYAHLPYLGAGLRSNCDRVSPQLFRVKFIFKPADFASQTMFHTSRRQQRRDDNCSRAAVSEHCLQRLSDLREGVGRHSSTFGQVDPDDLVNEILFEAAPSNRKMHGFAQPFTTLKTQVHN